MKADGPPTLLLLNIAGFSSERLDDYEIGMIPGWAACCASVPVNVSTGLRMKHVIFFAALSLAGPACAQSIDPELIAGCLPCHGADGISRFGGVPNLAGQNEPYLLNQLRAFHTGKRLHKEMSYMSRHMTEDEMEAIAAYFSSLPAR